MATVMNRIIEEQIRKWEHGSPADQPKTPKGNPFPVITISREFGALGAALAKHMGEKLGFNVWDKEIVQAIAEKLGSNESFLETLDENRRKTINDMVSGFLKNSTTNAGYFRTLNQVVGALEQHGNSVIVGRGANYICKDPKAFHLRLVSPFKDRTEQIASRENLTKPEARGYINKKDEERSEFVQYHFNKDVANAADYDLVLNSGVYSLDEMMKIVMLAYEMKTGLKLKLQKKDRTAEAQ